MNLGYLSALRWAISGWREDRPLMIARIVVTFAVGQLVYWNAGGSDQFGVSMNPKKTVGLGPKVGQWVYPQLPHGSTTAWSLKAVEIVTDYGRGFTDGAVLRRHGITTDFLCVLIPAPWWPTIEAAEKAHGAIKHPDRVTTEAQQIQSIANIWGNLYRFLHAALLWVVGGYIARVAVNPLAAWLRGRFPGLN